MNKLVRESLSFERGGDPRKTMKVGKLERLKEKYGSEELDILLTKASRLGNLEDVKFLIEQGADVHTYDDEVLRISAQKGHMDIIKYLIEKGYVIPNTRLGSAFTWAAVYGHLDIVKYLYEYGVKESFYGLAFRQAAKYDHLDIIKYFVKQGLDPSIDGNNPIVHAAIEGNLDIIKYLVEQGVNIHARNYMPLRHSAGAGNLDIVKYIIENAPYTEEDAINAALRMAINNNNREVSEYLMKLI